MEIKDLATVSGKGGLFKVLKPSKAGVILEATDGSGKKMVAGVHNKVSLLHEISIYTHTSEGSTPLENVLKKIYDEFGEDPDVDTSSGEELKSFFKHILPDYDESKVYTSDMKKVVNWYHTILKIAPEILSKSSDSEAEKETKPNKESEVNEESSESDKD